MTIHEALYKKLAATTAITDLVGTKIYQVERKQDEDPPALVFDEISGESTEEMTSGVTGLASTVFQLDCYGITAEAATDLREQVRLTLQPHRGAILGSGSPISGVYVYGCLMQGISSGFDPESRVFVRSIDFEIQHVEATS